MARDISPPTKPPSNLLNIPRGVALRIFVIILLARYTAPKISRKDRAIATEFAIRYHSRNCNPNHNSHEKSSLMYEPFGESLEER